MLQEQGGAEASRGNVSGILLNQKVGSPFDEETDWEMLHQFSGGFQELVEVSEISSYVVPYMD